ncbi:uncharacterized protein [Fopius arisanus]|uniref:SecA_0 protein n=1 Tax=Fopius arisanus TaxID=64838 RepID=A0A0C9R7J0_9HYME|nr:PREDICTED: uncharacterized protein LOC105273180 [Fopius arisanus]
MALLIHLLGICVLISLNCLAKQNCTVNHEWKKAREECEKEMDKTDDCFWNCVQGELGGLDDSGRPSLEKLSEAVAKVIKEPDVVEALRKSHEECISQFNDTMTPCEESKLLNVCSWGDAELQQALQGANYCVYNPANPS